MRKHDYYHYLFLLYGARFLSVFGALVTTVLLFYVVSDLLSGGGIYQPFSLVLIVFFYLFVVIMWFISWKFIPIVKKNKPTSTKPPEESGDQKN